MVASEVGLVLHFELALGIRLEVVSLYLVFFITGDNWYYVLQCHSPCDSQTCSIRNTGSQAPLRPTV